MTSYKVSPKYKKSVEEVEFFQSPDGNKLATIIVCWRGGEYVITPEDADEEEMLKNLDDAFVFEVTAFANWELISTWDGCSEDISFVRGFDEEEIDALNERLDEEEHNAYDFLTEEIGLDSSDMEIFIHNGVIVEPCESEYPHDVIENETVL